MRMFDDSDEGRDEERHADGDTEATGDVPTRGEPDDVVDPPPRRGKKPRRKKKLKEAAMTENPAQPLKDSRRQDDLDAIFRTIGERSSVNHQDEENPSGRRTKSAAPGGHADAGLDDQRREEERLRRKIERKRFMLSNPEAMLSFDEAAMLAEAKRRVERSRESGRMDKKTEMEEFNAIRREIQSFGASSSLLPSFVAPAPSAGSRRGCANNERDGSVAISGIIPARERARVFLAPSQTLHPILTRRLIVRRGETLLPTRCLQCL